MSSTADGSRSGRFEVFMRSRLLEIPIPFTDAAIPVFGYGLMIMLGYVVGTYAAVRRARGGAISRDDVLDYSLYAVLFGVIGARIAHVAMFWDTFFYRYDAHLRKPVFEASRLWDIFKIWEGGLVFYGGLFAAIAAMAVFVRARRISMLKLCDVGAPTVALGLAFGRVGCFLNGCCFGKISDVPWALSFPPESTPWCHQLQTRRIGLAAAGSMPVHPTQLYEAAGALALAAVLELAHRRRKFDGQTTALFFLMYAPGRFLVEMLRDDVPAAIPRLNSWITTAQYASVLLAAGGALVYFLWRGRAGASGKIAPAEP